MEQNQEAERPLYASLVYDVRKKLNISWAEYVLLDMVYHLSAKHGYCFKSMTSIASDLGLTFTGAKKMVKRLTDRELLVTKNGGLVCGSSYMDCAYLTKDVETPKTKQSSERKKTDQTKFRKAEIKKDDKVSETKLSSVNRNLVQKTELSSDKNNNRITIDSNTTNVVLGADAPVQYGKPEINEIITYWEQRVGYPLIGNITRNRRAAQTLLVACKKDMAVVKWLIDCAASTQGVRYAPQASDLIELKDKANALIAWARKTGKSSAVAQF